MADNRTGEEQLAARQAGRAGGDVTAAELRARTQADQREQRREEAKRFADQEFKRAQAEAKAEGRTVTSQTLRINLDSGRVKGKTVSTDSSNFRRPQDQTRVDSGLSAPPEVSKVRPRNTGGGGGEDDFAIGVPLKGAPGRVQEINPRTGDIRNVQFQRVEGPKRYTVDIEDSISGYIPGKTHFKVELNDRLSGGPYHFTRDVGAPIQKELSGIKAPAKDDFIAGAKGVATNTKEDFELGFFGSGFGIGSLFTGGKLSDAQMKRFAERGSEANERSQPEILADFAGASFTAGRGAVVGKQDLSGFEQLGKNIVENPKYFAGSALATGASFLTPGGAAKGIRALSAGLKVRKAEASLGEITSFGSKLSKPVSVKVEKNIVNIGTESDVSRFGVGIVEQKGVRFFSRETVPKQFIVPNKDITAYTRPGVKIGSRSDERLIDVGKLPKELPESFPLARRGEQFFEKVEITPGSKPAFLRVQPEEVPVATEQFMSFRSIKQMGSSEQGLKTFFGREDVGTRVTGARGAGGTNRPFDFSGAEKQQVTKQTLKDLGIVQAPAESKAADFSGLGLGKSLFSGARQETTRGNASLGFRGATGAERRRASSSEDFGFEFETVRFPGTSRASKNLQKSASDLSSGTVSAFGSGERLGGISKELGKFETVSIPKFSIGLKDASATKSKDDTTALLRSFSLEATTGFRTGTEFSQITRVDTQTIPTFKTDTIPITRITETNIPKVPNLDLGFGGIEEPRKRRKGKKGRKRKGETGVGNPLTAILGRDSKAGRRAAKFLNKFDFDF